LFLIFVLKKKKKKLDDWYLSLSPKMHCYSFFHIVFIFMVAVLPNNSSDNELQIKMESSRINRIKQGGVFISEYQCSVAQKI